VVHTSHTFCSHFSMIVMVGSNTLRLGVIPVDGIIYISAYASIRTVALNYGIEPVICVFNKL
jgi:hypothetical protein